MDIRVLRYFLEIAREENMTRAADILRVSQPTLSRQMSLLEEETGRKLFERSNHSIRLTKEGTLLKKRAEQIVDLADRTLSELRLSDEETGGDIYIGAAESLSFDHLAGAFKQLQNTDPEVCLHLYSGNTEAIEEKLRNGQLDFALVVQDVDHSHYNSISFPGADRWGVLVPENHPFARKNRISTEDLLGERLIVSRQSVREDLPKLFRNRMEQLKIAADYDLIFNASRLVLAGAGLALAFEGLISVDINSGLVFRVLEPALYTSMHLIWKRNQKLSYPASQLLEIIEIILSESDNQDI